jgi:hypothetical protein
MNIARKKLMKEVFKTGLFFVDMDLEMFGKISEDTKTIFEVQGFKLPKIYNVVICKTSGEKIHLTGYPMRAEKCKTMIQKMMPETRKRARLEKVNS